MGVADDALLHDRYKFPHSGFSSAMCEACVARCFEAGPDAMAEGPTYINEHGDEWMAEDGHVQHP